MKNPHLAAFLAGTLVHFETMGPVSAMVEASSWMDEYSSHCPGCSQRLGHANRELESLFESPEGSYEAGLGVNSVVDVPVMTAEIYRLYYPEPGSF
jgi:hypothetical protein